jgi:glycine oxidase
LDVERLGSRDCRTLEPMLSPRIRGGVHVGGERSVDPRATCRALVRAAERAGASIVRTRVTHIAIEDGRVAGIRLADGSVVEAAQVVVALGCWAADVGLPPEVCPPVRPVKGQIVRLRFEPDDPPLTRNIRGLARGSSVYLVPRVSGELVVGATVEEKGFDTMVTAGGVHELLDAAIDLVPVVAELEVVETLARLRPGSPDNAPILGPTTVDGLTLAAGHHRNGVLLAPVTADAVAALLVDGSLPEVAEPFTIARFR